MWAVVYLPALGSIAIKGDQFLINGRPTYEGRRWRGMRIQGLLMNSRMVQGIFDDLNPDTRSRWAYPDTGRWDADRNTREFIAAIVGCAFSLRRVLRIDPAAAIGTIT